MAAYYKNFLKKQKVKQKNKTYKKQRFKLTLLTFNKKKKIPLAMQLILSIV